MIMTTTTPSSSSSTRARDTSSSLKRKLVVAAEGSAPCSNSKGQQQYLRRRHRTNVTLLLSVLCLQRLPSSCHAFGSHPIIHTTAATSSSSASIPSSVRRKRLDYSNSVAIEEGTTTISSSTTTTSTSATSSSSSSPSNSANRWLAENTLWEPLLSNSLQPQQSQQAFVGTVQEKKRRGTFTKEKPTERTYAGEEDRLQLADRIAQLLSDDDDDDEDDEEGNVDHEISSSSSEEQQIADRQTIMSQLSQVDKSAATFAVAAEAMPLSSRQFASSTTSTKKATQRITASVLETGQDTMKQYVKTLGAHQVLSREDEVVLGQQVQLLTKWERHRQELEVSLQRSPTFAEWATSVNTTVPELKRQVRRSQKAKAALVEANFRLVISVARQTVKTGRSELCFQDACQEGILGLMRAVDKYDPTLGFRFSTYAIWWIKKMIHANVAQQTHAVRLPANVLRKINDIRIQERVLRLELHRKPTDEEVAAKVGISVEQLNLYRNSANDIISLDKQVKFHNNKSGNNHNNAAAGDENNGPSLHSLVEDTSTFSPTAMAEHQSLQDDLNRLVKSCLSPKEQAVIRLRFGMGTTTTEPLSMEQVARKFQVDAAVIRSLETKAILKLRQFRNHDSMKSYLTDL